MQKEAKAKHKLVTIAAIIWILTILLEIYQMLVLAPRQHATFEISLLTTVYGFYAIQIGWSCIGVIVAYAFSFAVKRHRVVGTIILSIGIAMLAIYLVIAFPVVFHQSFNFGPKIQTFLYYCSSDRTIGKIFLIPGLLIGFGQLFREKQAQ